MTARRCEEAAQAGQVQSSIWTDKAGLTRTALQAEGLRAGSWTQGPLPPGSTPLLLQPRVLSLTREGCTHTVRPDSWAPSRILRATGLGTALGLGASTRPCLPCSPPATPLPQPYPPSAFPSRRFPLSSKTQSLLCFTLLLKDSGTLKSGSLDLMKTLRPRGLGEVCKYPFH